MPKQDPPPENPTYIMIDTQNFYLAETVSQQYNTVDLNNQLQNLQSQIEVIKDMLYEASLVGVTGQPANSTSSSSSSGSLGK